MDALFGKLFVDVIEAHELVAKEFLTSDCFARLILDSQTYQTQVIKGTLKPKWNASFTFDIAQESSSLIITLYDKNKSGKEDFMGQVTLPISSLKNTARVDDWHELQRTHGGKEKVKGSIHIAHRFESQIVSHRAQSTLTLPIRTGTTTSLTNIFTPINNTPIVPSAATAASFVAMPSTTATAPIVTDDDTITVFLKKQEEALRFLETQQVFLSEKYTSQIQSLRTQLEVEKQNLVSATSLLDNVTKSKNNLQEQIFAEKTSL